MAGACVQSVRSALKKTQDAIESARAISAPLSAHLHGDTDGALASGRPPQR
jgi:hypothetical protein